MIRNLTLMRMLVSLLLLVLPGWVAGCANPVVDLLVPSGGLPELANPPLVVQGLPAGGPVTGLLVKELGDGMDHAVAVLPAVHEAAILEAARAAPGGLTVSRAYDVPLTAELLAPRTTADGRVVEPVFAAIRQGRSYYDQPEGVAMTAAEFLAVPGPAASSAAQRVVAGDPRRSPLGDSAALIVIPERSGRYWYKVQAISAERPETAAAGERGPWKRLVASSHELDGRLIGLRLGFRHSTRTVGALSMAPPGVVLAPESRVVYLLANGELWRTSTRFPRPSEPRPR